MSERPPPIEVTEPLSITVNGEPVVAQRGELVIDACERAGTYVPRFCYHPRLEPVGMCRMCLVEIDTGRGPALQPSCMIECVADMAVDTESDRVVKAQDGVLEFLLINHPLDCPVCDKGGECPLQDQTMSYGPGESRWVEEKRHYAKPIAISDTVYLDRERCILCDRCTRFASDVAGDTLIHFMDRGANTQVNTFPDHPFASYFSGNTVQICPVGALTAKPYRFKARPWDLAEVESTCTGCSVGCRVAVQSSRDRLLRYQGVDVDPVNWGWLCDKGRFGFEAVNAPERLGGPLLRSGSELSPAGWSDALDAAAGAIRGAVTVSGPGSVAVLGGARLTNEAAYVWAKLAKGVIGTDHCDAQLGDGLPADLLAGLPAATIDQVCAPGGTVVYLGPDPKEELPVLFLRLRHAAVNDAVHIVEIAPTATSLTPLAAAHVTYRPGDVASVVDALVATSPSADPRIEAARAIVAGAEGAITVVIGRPSAAETAGPLVDAAGALLAALPDASFLPVLRRSNVRGAIDAGLAPGLLPGRVRRADGAAAFAAAWGTVPTADGLDAAGILSAAAEGRIDTLVLLGADPARDFPDRALAERGLSGVRNIIAVDQFLTDSSRRAGVVLAAAGFGEVDGTTTNVEGRVSVVRRKVSAPGTARSDLALAAELARRLGADLGIATEVEARAEMQALSPLHAGLTEALLDSSPDGVVVPVAEVGSTGAGPAMATFVPGPRSGPPHNDAYSLRLVATRSLFDHGTLLSHSPSQCSMVADAVARLHPSEAGKIGVTDGDRIRVLGNDSSLVVAVGLDAGVPVGSVAIGWGRADVDLGRLINVADAAVDVRIEVAR